MNIRLLNEDDAEFFRALCIEAVEDSPSAFGESSAEVNGKSLPDFADQLATHDRGDFVSGAFDEVNRLIGVLGLYRAIHAKLSHKGALWGMYVTPARRQLGVGRALVATTILHARNLPTLS